MGSGTIVIMFFITLKVMVVEGVGGEEGLDQGKGRQLSYLLPGRVKYFQNLQIYIPLYPSPC